MNKQRTIEFGIALAIPLLAIAGFAYGLVFHQDQLILSPNGSGVIVSTSTAFSAFLTASTSPTVVTLTATSTTGTSEFRGNLLVGGSSTHSTTTVQGYLNTGILTATSSITTNNLTINGTCTGCAGFAYPFTPTSNLGQTMSATSSSILITGSNGFYANGASQFSTTTVQGYFNTGIITSTSTGNYLGDLSLGVKLPNAQLANSTISGIALGSNLANLTATNGTLTFSATYNGSAAATIGLNLNQQNTWTASSTHPVLNTGTLTATSSIQTNTLQATASSTFAGYFNNGNATTSGNLAIINGQLIIPYASTTGQAVTQTINWNNGTNQRIILQANNTNIVINATSSSPQSGGKYILKICQSSVAYTGTNWATPNNLRWQGGGGATTTITTTANYCQLVGMIYDDRTQIYDVVASSTPGFSQ